MSSTAIQQLQQDLLNELTTANQLLQLIAVELQEIKQLTNPGGEIETNITQNATLMTTLARLQNVNIDNLPPMSRTQIDI